jgi:hypothetical protein
MRRRDHVHADVRNRAGKGEHEKRRVMAERGRLQTARGDQAAAGDERPPGLPRGMASITPPSTSSGTAKPTAEFTIITNPIKAGASLMSANSSGR